MYLGLNAPAENRAITGWSTDTRTLSPGDLYFALKGDTHDGHMYIAAALEKGAAGAVVQNTAEQAWPLFQVPDTLAALQQVARSARTGWPGTVVGITGSAGKTSTKDAVAHLLESAMPVGRTVGNLNNHIGLPLSLLRVPDTAKAAVLEMGMNHSGEIRALASIAKPDIGVVTNVGHAHIEFFDSIEGIALAKRELIEALPPEGTAILNADDERVVRFGDVHQGATITYGFSEGAQIRAELLSPSRFRCLGTTFDTQLTGAHALSNIVAGIAVAQVFGIAAAHLAEPVRSLTPGKMRGERLAWNGITVFNDCYNSNPAAAEAMLDVLAAEPAIRRVAVLGEMLELGSRTEPLHRGVGRHAAESGIDVLIAVRGAASFMADEAREAGMSGGAAYFFEDPAEAGRAVHEIAQPGDAVLFKGSRGVHMELALEAFQSASRSAA